ncbi:MAG: DedA family protein [Halobacteriota archaeon]
MLAVSVNVIETISNFIIATIEQFGYAGVFVAMLLESTGVPLPSEVIMPFAGYVAWAGKLTLLGVAIAGTLGCLAGALVLYVIGLYGGRPLIDRYGKYVFIRKSELDRADKWFAQYGDITVFVSRMLPIVRSFFSLPAGMTHMNLAKFSLYTTLGSFPWCLALAYLGFFLGPRWSDVRQLFRYFNIAVIIGVVALIAYLIYNRKRIAARMQNVE